METIRFLKTLTDRERERDIETVATWRGRDKKAAFVSPSKLESLMSFCRSHNLFLFYFILSPQRPSRLLSLQYFILLSCRSVPLDQLP